MSKSDLMYTAYVQRAIEEAKKGNTIGLTKLCSQFDEKNFEKNLNSSNNDKEDENLISNKYKEDENLIKTKNILNAITNELTNMESEIFNPLILNIIKLNFLNKGVIILNSYSNFLNVLVSSSPKWFSEICNSLLILFIHPNGSCINKVHEILKNLISLVPTCSNILNSLILKNFPHKNDDLKYFLRYIKNILLIINYFPEVRSFVWALIFERLIQIDVELQQELDDLDENLDENLDEIFDNIISDGGTTTLQSNTLDNVDNDLSSDNLSINSLDSQNQIYVNHSNLPDFSTKLDILISFLLKYLKPFFDKDHVSSFETAILYGTLLNHFKSYLLFTHKTRSIQFILFTISQSSTQYIDAFLVLLIEISLSPSENVNIRQKSMQYIASYLARAKSLSRNQILFVVSLLSGWLDRYINEREYEVDHTKSMERFKMFYTVAQSLFYVFCFRHSLFKKLTLVDDDNENHNNNSLWEYDIDRLFMRIIISKFNPLKYCDQVVVNMFAKIARQQNAVYCYSIIDQNRRSIIRNKSNQFLENNSIITNNDINFTSLSTTSNQLWADNKQFTEVECYFPFDPLFLKKSRALISPLYIEWSSVAQDLDDEDDFDEDEKI